MAMACGRSCTTVPKLGMASIQQLEKLYELQRIFSCGDTLESAVAGERVSLLISRTEKLIHQRTFLREERRLLRQYAERIDERKRALTLIQRNDWIPQSIIDCSSPTDTKLKLNISGLLFEMPTRILSRDKKSLLAQLCGPEPPMSPDSEGVFAFDRDWWLFRHIAIFLRDGCLPEDRQLLAQLYKEAAYWNLSELQIAIEEDKVALHLRKDPDSIDKTAWWRSSPNWWQAIDEAKKKSADEAAQAAAKKEDWWTDSAFKGKTYLPIPDSSAKDFVHTTFSK